MSATRRTLLLCTALLASAGACSGGDDDGAATTTTETTVLPGRSVADLTPGDCLAGLPDGTRDRVETVDCSAEHRAEVYAVADLDDGPFPGAAEVSELSAQRCAGRYGRYAGEPIDPTTNRAFAEIVPSLGSWEDGDRRIVCLALPPAGATERGSIADGAPETPAPS